MYLPICMSSHEQIRPICFYDDDSDRPRSPSPPPPFRSRQQNKPACCTETPAPRRGPANAQACLSHRDILMLPNLESKSKQIQRQWDTDPIIMAQLPFIHATRVNQIHTTWYHTCYVQTYITRVRLRSSLTENRL